MFTTPSKVLLGTELGDPGNTSGPSQSYYQTFTNGMGQAPVLIDTYIDDGVQPSSWGDSANYAAWGIQNANATYTANMIPVVGIPMAIIGDDADADFKAIAGGSWDAGINNVFQNFVSHGFKTFYIRPGWEMNGDWYPWSVNQSNAADFAAAFRHIADLAHSYSGANIEVTWNPGYVTSSTSYQSIFPGAQYVDSIGIDTYGAASGVPDTAPFDNSTNPNTFTLQDAIALAKSTGKPLSLPETGGGPGDTALPANLASVLADSHVQVAYVNIWDDVSGGMANLHWSDDPAAAAAWKSAFASIAANNGGPSIIEKLPPSPDRTVVMAGSPAAIIDASGNAWTITSGKQIAVNGVIDAVTHHVT